MPRHMEFRFLQTRFRKTVFFETTSGARTGEASNDQHSSSTVMLGRPSFPEAPLRHCFAISILMAFYK